MNAFELHINRKIKRFSGPSTWAELDDRQAVALMRFRELVPTQRQTLFAALRLLYGMKPRHQRWLFDGQFLLQQGLSEDDTLLTLAQGQLLLDALNWIGQDDDDATFPRRFRLYDHHYGTPRVWLKRCFNRQLYAGPGSALGNCTFEEFMFADKAYRDRNLPLLAAILCRPVAVNPRPNDTREPFDKATAEARAKQFEQLDPALLHRITFGFSCSQLILQKIFRFVFPKKQTEETPDSRKTNKSVGTWLDVAIGMAKMDVTKIREIEQINVYLALKVLNEQIRQAEEMEAQLESMKAK